MWQCRLRATHDPAPRSPSAAAAAAAAVVWTAGQYLVAHWPVSRYQLPMHLQHALPYLRQ